ncbi:hypothetical protein DPX16_10005 [Anabarilius grahami]|uniref:Uncharacterized protein n=1 Tax=Anabarilius grahami TaxID=495550 RepID=A0A3N0XWW8_ANAGA|nr:hypothetical protein DPX16_10005 [Anabarilius grahami]
MGETKSVWLLDSHAKARLIITAPLGPQTQKQESPYAVDTVNTVQSFCVLRQNADSVLAGSCVSITRMRCAAHVYSFGQ